MAYKYEENSDIGELVRKAEQDFISGTTTVSKYVDFNLAEDINKIYAYLESKHTSGDTDSLGREKPFFNIVLAARNIWFRATDIDRKNIRIRPTKSSDDLAAFLATVQLQEWMRRENFGTFLNAWGINSAAFNESVLKFVEQGGRLIPSVVPWNRIICDPIDFKNNPKIEVLELTEAQLRKNKQYNKELVDKLCNAREARETTEGQDKDTKADYIKLYEVHGELPLSYLTGNEEDEDEFVQQMHVITFVARKENGKYDDFTLYSGREAKDPYMLAALLPEVDGSIALRGSVKTLFDAQWMQNHTAKLIKDNLDICSQVWFQTSDPTFQGQNATSAMRTGDFLIHKVNEPLQRVDNTNQEISALQTYGQMWKQLGNEITGISESMLGVNPPSGTAWRQTQALLQENHSLFELMTENRGLDMEYALREYVLPFLKKKMDTTKEVAATLDAHQIQKVDAAYITSTAVKAANDMVKEKILNGELPEEGEQALFMQQHATETQSALQAQGTQRYFKPSDLDDKTWKEVFKDLEWEVEVDVTNENLDTAAMETLNTLLATIAGNPQIVNEPNARMIINKILRLSGTVSTVELAAVPPPQPQQEKDTVSESMNYKDTPEDIKRQIEAKAGLQPSKITNVPVEPPLNEQAPEAAAGQGMGQAPR